MNDFHIESPSTNSSASVYQAYPAQKPFINTEWTAKQQYVYQNNNASLPSKAFPESNRDCNLIFTAKNTEM
jgi:hypothetical protein